MEGKRDDNIAECKVIVNPVKCHVVTLSVSQVRAPSLLCSKKTKAALNFTCAPVMLPRAQAWESDPSSSPSSSRY